VQDFIPRKKSGKHKERRQKEEGKKDLRKIVKVLYVVMFTSLPRQNLMNCHVQEQK